jgi:Transposase DDE domain
MATAYNTLIPALKKRLPEEALDLLGRAVCFVRRLREIEASRFVWCVVLSRFGQGRPGFEEARRWYQRLGGRLVWPRPFQMRFKAEAAVALFARAFEQAVAPWRGPESRRPHHLLARKFADVVAWDSTGVQVADELRRHFKGTRSAKAAIKILVAISVFGLLPLFGQVTAGNVHDMLLFPPLKLFRAGTLLLFDKGFVAYERLKEIADASLLYLCPMRHNGIPVVVRVRRGPAWLRKALKRHPEGVRLRTLLPRKKRLSQHWDLEVRIIPKTQSIRAPKRSWIHTRLVITPGPRGRQHPYLTNLSPVEWKPAAVRELYRLRWQVELIFKELKQHLHLEHLPSKDRHAVQIFAWASLIALAISRTVRRWVMPAIEVVGLANRARPMLITRALVATVRLLGRALVLPIRRAILLLRVLADEILGEVAGLDTRRPDSFCRLVPLLTDGGRP